MNIRDLLKPDAWYCQKCAGPLTFHAEGSQTYSCQRCQMMWPAENIVLFGYADLTDESFIDSRALVVAPQEDAKFIPPAEDALHVAICQAVQERHGPTANAILRTALDDYKPTQLTRTELIRVQQRSGSGEVTAVMVSPAAPSPSSPVQFQPPVCVKCGHEERFSDNEGGFCEKQVAGTVLRCDCYCEFVDAAPAPEQGQVQCADCMTWIDRNANHTCRQQVRRNQRATR